MTHRNDVGNEDFEQPRPVVDAASFQKRRQDVIGAAMGVVFFIPTMLLLYDPDLLTAAQLAGTTTFLGLISGALMVIVGRVDYKTALKVETQVTPSASAMSDDGVPLVPQVLVVAPDEGYVA